MRTTLHALLWISMTMLLFAGTSIWWRPHVIARSFGTSWLVSTSTRPFERYAPLAYLKEMAETPGVESMSWVTVDHSDEAQTRPYEIIAASDNAFGSVDSSGRLHTRSLGPDWIVLDGATVKRWQADPQGVIVARNMITRYGWRVGDVFEAPLPECGRPMKVTIVGVATGSVGNRMLAHYERLNEMREGCPSHDGVTIFEMEVEGAKQEAVATAIDRHFEHRGTPIVTYPSTQFYWNFFALQSLDSTRAHTAFLLSVAFVVFVAAFLLGRPRARASSWATQAFAALVAIALLLRFRTDGIHWSSRVWGFENVVPPPEALIATLLVTTGLTAGWPTLHAIARRGAARLHRVPSSGLALLIGAIAATLVTGVFAIPDGIDRAAHASPLRDTIAIYPQDVGTREELAALSERLTAGTPAERCVALHLTVGPYHWRNAAGVRGHARVDAHRTAPESCGLTEPGPVAEAHAIVDVDAATHWSTFPLQGTLWPVTSSAIRPDESVTWPGITMTVPDLLASFEFGDRWVDTLLLARSVPASLARYPSEPWPRLVHGLCWNDNDSRLALSTALMIGTIAIALLWSGRRTRRRGRIGMLVLGVVAGVVMVAVAGRLGAGGVQYHEDYSVRYQLAVGETALRAAALLGLALVAVEWLAPRVFGGGARLDPRNIDTSTRGTT